MIIAGQRYVHLTSCVYFQSIAKHIETVNMAMFVILETNSARMVSIEHVLFKTEISLINCYQECV